MKLTPYPRLVTNGRHYRIEIAKWQYDTEWISMLPRKYIWETRYFWCARRRLIKLLRANADAESRKPEKWKPVFYRYYEDGELL